MSTMLTDAPVTGSTEVRYSQVSVRKFAAGPEGSEGLDEKLRAAIGLQYHPRKGFAGATLECQINSTTLPTLKQCLVDSDCS